LKTIIYDARMDLQRALDLARRAVDRCRILAQLSEDEGKTTRTFLTPPMHDVHRLVRGWMESAGLKVTIDPIGNIRGSLPGPHSQSPRLFMGSHLDTVPGAGAFDGILGVMAAIGLVEALNSKTPEYGIEVCGFSEEEGVRFGAPFLGSRAVTGGLDRSILERTDARGITMREAIRNFGLDPDRLGEAADAANVLGYVEFHIEQGPVLDSLNIPVGVVDAIVGQSRLELTFRGKTNHAGTTPMHLRRDALPASSEWILEVEREAAATPGLVATVGSITALPGASNVIAGVVRATLDVRHADDGVRTTAVRHMLERAQAIAERRKLEWSSEVRLEQSAVACDAELTNTMVRSVEMAGFQTHRMVSGAGHDAMVMATRMPVAMLFIRSPEGVSHHSAETVNIDDVAASLQVGWHFLKQVAAHHASVRTN
jgi:allantoate deiminase